MKKAKPVKARAKKAKRTGPSKRTAAERKAIDKRAAEASAKSKRIARAHARRDAVAQKKGGPLSVRCPACRAAPGIACFDIAGAQRASPHAARKVGLKLQPLAATLAPMVAATAGNKGKAAAQTERETIDAQRMKSFGVTHYSPQADLIDPKAIKVGERHRKDFGDLKALARSIDDRGGLIQPIALTGKRELIAGERRIKAWALSRFAGQPIPYHVLDVDAIIAGEWDENAQRKDFTPSEAVKIKRTLEDVLRNLHAAHAASGKRGRPATGRVNDKVAAVTGVQRRSLEKAEKVVAAAERDPGLFGDLQTEMDRTGKVNSAHKKLKVREAKAAIVAAPPAMPMNAKDCATWSIDFPWAGEPDRDQAALDAAGRSWRPYAEMSIKTICQFCKDQIVPNLPDDAAVWLWTTNFHLVRGYAHHVIAALGFKPESASTMLTWNKVELGRGQILRDVTEHAILLTRGKVTIDVFGTDPPTTLITEARRENSRKPDVFYRLVERVTPAKRYASIFSQGGEGENWDGHGDQVGKFAPAIARAAEQELIGEAKAGDPPASEKSLFDAAAERMALAQIDAGGLPTREDATSILAKRGLAHVGTKTVRLTNLGKERLDTLNASGAPAKDPDQGEPEQIDIEQAIAAKAAPSGEEDGLAELERLGLRRVPEEAAV